MKFNEIIEQIVSRIEEVSSFNKEEIKPFLNIYRSNTQDFVLFFNQLSTSAEETAFTVYEKLKEKSFPEITNLKHDKTSISFSLNKKLYFKDILKTIHSKNVEFGRNSIGIGKTLVVEYSSPNIAKVFHVGHFRTTVLGNFIKNLTKVCGYNTIAMNYLGDWGKQFGMVLQGYKTFGSDKELKSDALMHLFNIYVKVNEQAKCDPTVHDKARAIFKDMEENENKEYIDQWKVFRELSIQKYTELYKKLNVEFDVYSGESIYYKDAKKFAETNQISITDEDNSKFVDCGSLGKALIQKSDGTTLYLTRDICAAIDRIKKYNPHKIIYVVSNEQDLHLSQLFYCMDLLGYDKNRFQHVNYGRVHGMSKRSGTVHFIEDILESCSNDIKTKFLDLKGNLVGDKDEIAYILALTIVLVADFSAKRIKGYTFNADQRANCERGQGAMLQYAHCRLKGIEKMNSNIDISDITDLDFDAIDLPEIHSLCYKLIWYERVLELCLEDFEPSRLITYLLELAADINGLNKKLRVKEQDEKVAKARLLVFNVTRQVLSNAFSILSIIPLNEM